MRSHLRSCSSTKRGAAIKLALLVVSIRKGKAAADALIENKFIQMKKKKLMNVFETLRSYQRPPAWNEHLPYGAFGS